MDNRLIISADMNNQIIELAPDNTIDIVIEDNVAVTIIERVHYHDQTFKRAISVGQSAHVTYMYEQYFNCAIEHTFTIGASAQVNMFLFIKPFAPFDRLPTSPRLRRTGRANGNHKSVLGDIEHRRNIEPYEHISAVRQQLNAQIYADASFNCKGLYLVHDAQIIDIVSMQHHCQARACSSVTLKGVLFNDSRASYKGTIHIDQQAVQSSAQQYNKNLMIGALSRATSIPSLEVLTDNVSCKHGTAMSSINSEDLFYFQLRGLQESYARTLFIEAFCNDAIDEVEAWAAQCKEFIMERV